MSKYKPIKQKPNQAHSIDTDYTRKDNQSFITEGLDDFELEILNGASLPGFEMSRETVNLSSSKKVGCKNCLITDTWICSERFPNGNKKWRDSSGLICNGRVCGTCNRDRSKNTMRRVREGSDVTP